MLSLYRFISLRHTYRKISKGLLTICGIALGVALFVAVFVINRSISGSLRENVEAVTGKAALTVSAGEPGFPEDRLAIIEKMAGVGAAIPAINTRAYLPGARGEHESVMVLGVDLLKESSVRNYQVSNEEVIDDPLVFLNQPDSIILTRSFASRHGYQVNSPIVLATAHGSKRFVVRGLLTAVGPAKAYDGAIAIMDIDGARQSFGKDGKLDRVDIVLKPGAELDQVRRELVAALGPGYLIERPAEQAEGMEKMIRAYQAMLSFFSTLALFASFVLVWNTMSVSVAERTREIGILRTQGATRGNILSLFLAESAVYGVAGSGLGFVLGAFLSRRLSGLVGQSMATHFLSEISIPAVQVTLSDFLLALGVGALSTVLAALWPSLKATRVDPIRAIRDHKAGAEDSRGARRARIAFLAGVACLCLVALLGPTGLAARFPVAQLANNIFAIIGCVLLGPMLAFALLWSLRPLLNRCGGTISRLAQDNLLRSYPRVSTNIMSLTVGLLLVVITTTLSQSFEKTITSWFSRTMHWDLLVSSGGDGLTSFHVQPLAEDIGRELALVPGVKADSSGSACGIRYIQIDYQGKRIGLKAVDRPDAGNRYDTIDVIDRPVRAAVDEFFDSRRPVVMVSESFALHFRKKTGDAVELATPTGVVTARISGILRDYASSEGVIYLYREHYKRLWKDGLVSGFAIRVQEGWTPGRVRQEIDRKFGKERNLTVVITSELRNQVTEAIHRSFSYVHAIELIALIVALVGFVNNLLISVYERTREMGMLRAVGMSRRQMFRMIMQESVIQGVYGSVAAVVLGLGLAYLWATQDLARILGWVIQWHFPLTGILGALLTGIVLASIAGLYPAARAAKIQIREVLSYE